MRLGTTTVLFTAIGVLAATTPASAKPLGTAAPGTLNGSAVISQGSCLKSCSGADCVTSGEFGAEYPGPDMDVGNWPNGIDFTDQLLAITGGGYSKGYQAIQFYEKTNISVFPDAPVACADNSTCPESAPECLAAESGITYCGAKKTWSLFDEILTKQICAPEDSMPPLGNCPDQYNYNTGYSLAVSGDVIAIGSPAKTSGTIKPPPLGRVFIYRKVGNEVVYEATIQSALPEKDRQFGFSVDLYGDLLVVGEPGVVIEEGVIDGKEAKRYGRVHIYKYENSEWVSKGNVTTEQWDIDFGYTVKIDPKGAKFIAVSGLNMNFTGTACKYANSCPEPPPNDHFMGFILTEANDKWSITLDALQGGHAIGIGEKWLAFLNTAMQHTQLDIKLGVYAIGSSDTGPTFTQSVVPNIYEPPSISYAAFTGIAVMGDSLLLADRSIHTCKIATGFNKTSWTYDGGIRWFYNLSSTWKMKAINPASSKCDTASIRLGARLAQWGDQILVTKDKTTDIYISGPSPKCGEIGSIVEQWSLTAAPGGECDVNSNCGNGQCIDGACCESACDGLCQACSQAAGGTAPDGQCSDVVCDDDTPCTSAKCDVATDACVFGAVTNCDDNDACTIDACEDGETVTCTHEPVVCEDDDICTANSCDKATGCAYSEPPNCDDSDVCTTDSCQGPELADCQNDPVECDDENLCTANSCDPIEGCQYSEAPNCDDNNLCTIDQCTSPNQADCTNESKVCDDNSACTADSCDPDKGCVYEFLVDCDDGNPCTADLCLGPTEGDCVHHPAALECDDGDACTSLDTCIDGQCTGLALGCADDTNPCTNDKCTATLALGNNPVTRLVGKHRQVCTLRKHGTTEDNNTNCWGDISFIKPKTPIPCTGVGCSITDNVFNYGQTIDPSDKTFVAIASGERHTCGLEADGTPTCWGKDLSGQSSPPDGMKYNEIAAGNLFSCGIRKDNGDIQCWGSKEWLSTGQITLPGGPYHQITATGEACKYNLPSTQLACSERVCALSLPANPPIHFSTNQLPGFGAFGINYPTSGQIRCWDMWVSNYGNKNPKFSAWIYQSDKKLPTIAECLEQNCPVETGASISKLAFSPDPGGSYVDVSVALMHVCALDKNGAVSCWGSAAGNGNKGQYTLPDWFEEEENNKDFIDIRVANFTSCATRSDGYARCWGQYTKTFDGTNTLAVQPHKEGLVQLKKDGSLEAHYDWKFSAPLCEPGGGAYCKANNKLYVIYGKTSPNLTLLCGEGTNSCDDFKVCTTDLCDENDGSCSYQKKNWGSCNDGDPCTLSDGCDNGVCVGELPKPCNDNNLCTLDSCSPVGSASPGTCVHEPITGECDDGDVCTENDNCSTGTCVGAPANCDDGNACTDDSCDPENGCVNLETAAACDDGNACTENDACVAGACEGVAVECNDDNVCTDDSCDSQIGCVNTDNSAECDDGAVCTVAACSGGKCVTGADVNCDDGSLCTVDSCDAVIGCVNALASCNDNDLCTVDSCISETGLCVNTPTENCCVEDEDCPESGDCLEAVCDQKKNECTTEPIEGCCSDNTDCDDENACTEDSCEDDATCQNTALENCCLDDASCNDNNACTTDSCTDNVCLNEVVVVNCCTSDADCNDGLVCVDGLCDEVITADDGADDVGDDGADDVGDDVGDDGTDTIGTIAGDDGGAGSDDSTDGDEVGGSSDSGCVAAGRSSKSSNFALLVVVGLFFAGLRRRRQLAV